MPTIGASPVLRRCLEALAHDGARTTVVAPTAGVDAGLDDRLAALVAAGLVARLVRVPPGTGFAAANNVALATIDDEDRGPWVALVNDDAIVEPGWGAALVGWLEARPRAAAAQGLVLRLDDPTRIDGWGIGWNRWSQAVQRGHGRPIDEAPRAPRPLFGVSATAAVYRMDALRAVARTRGGRVFEERLESYYEDVELAARLRAVGLEAWTVPAARALHAGSSSGGALPWSGRALIHGNRLLVLAALLGRRLWLHLLPLLARDARDLVGRLLAGDPRGAVGVVVGLGRAVRRLPGFARFGRPLLPIGELRGAEPFDSPRVEVLASSPSVGARGAGVVVQWGDADALLRLLDAWPPSPRWRLVIVDNGTLDTTALDGRIADDVVVLRPGRNLGFGGGVQHGARAALDDGADAILVLNPDARPTPEALEALRRALDEHPDAAGVVPALVGVDGRSQHRWQLQPLPRPWTLLAQVFFLAGRRGPVDPPPAGTPIEQPAAAALVLRRSIVAEHPFDPRFHPAWFEDVDLCRRLHDAGERLVYAPDAVFVHEGGASVPSLGYGPFLWLYLRNLHLYLTIHHGPVWPLLARLSTPVAALLRLLALPLRRPRRARSRLDAARGLLQVAIGGLSGWRRPRALAERFARPQDAS